MCLHGSVFVLYDAAFILYDAAFILCDAAAFILCDTILSKDTNRQIFNYHEGSWPLYISK